MKPEFMMKNKKILIVDYKLSNLFSVSNACQLVGFEPLISSNKAELENADALILPGVGSFPDAMKNLKDLDLIGPLIDFAQSGKPILGVCLGLQLMFSESEEFYQTKGLGLIEGIIRKFPKQINGHVLKVPHMGWNQIYSAKQNWNSGAYSKIKENEFMYFVHSYYVTPTDQSTILSLTNYHDFEFCSSIQKKNLIATQFHPEKSGKPGLTIYQQWKELIFINDLKNEMK